MFKSYPSAIAHNHIFAKPQGNFYEARFVNYLASNNIVEAYNLFRSNIRNININREIDGSSLFSHAISAFSKEECKYNLHIFMQIILFMVQYGADINAYDPYYKTTMFTRLCDCEITEEFFSLLLSQGAWPNPEEQLPQDIFPVSKTPLGELASNINVNLVRIACEAGANPNSSVFQPGKKHASLLEYVITVAADCDHLEEEDTAESFCSVVLTLQQFGADIDPKLIELLRAQCSDNNNSAMLQDLLHLLNSTKPTV